MATKNKPAPSPDILITRLFEAPRDLVWKAWTDPRHLMQWWGPKSYTAPFCNMDFHVGGTYLFRMRSPEGRDYWTTGVYREIVPRERIVYTDSFADGKGNPVPASYYGMGGNWPAELVVTVTFEELDQGRTKLTLRHTGIPAGQMSELTGVGWNESLDKLAASLDNQADTADREIAAMRLFDAPRELIFQMWTDPEHIGHWWGPRGFTTTTQEMDVRPGGVWRHVMHSPDGVNYPNRIVYREVIRPERLVYTHDSGTEDDPGEFRVTVIFAMEGEKTRLTMRMVFKSAAARNKVAEEFHAIEGLHSTLDRLREYLACA